MKAPLAMYVLWHTQFREGSIHAETIFSEFNRNVEDPLARGIGIPVFFRNNGPLEPIKYDVHQFVVIVALIDATFVLDNDPPDLYSKYLRDIVNTAPVNTLVIPIAFEKSAFALELNNLNFVRLYEKKNTKEFLINYIAHETTRHLYALEKIRTGSPPPLRLFISHAKVDGVDIAKQIKGFVESSFDLKTFFDANDIAIGYDFTKEIEDNIKTTVVIAIHTDNYSSREWCRREVLLAKLHNRPIVVLNCFKNGESRSFPYMANVLTVHFSSIEEGVLPLLITAIMKETLRLKYQELFTKYQIESLNIDVDLSESISGYPPELVTILSRREKLNGVFIYPDPPIGIEEISVIKKLDGNIRYITPSELFSTKESIPAEKGAVVGISISETSEMNRRGLSVLHLQNCMIEIARFLLHRGYTLAYGGDLNYETSLNFLEILFQLSMTYSGVANGKIVNYSAFPLYTKISTAREAEIKRVASIKRVNPSTDFDSWSNVRYDSANDEQRAYLNKLFESEDAETKDIWSQSLTKMREVMTEEISTRIVLGGKMTGYRGRMPGIKEEIELSIKKNQTVFIIDAFGGAAKDMVGELISNDKLSAINSSIFVVTGDKGFKDIEGFLKTLPVL